jgi:hypothetical protein
MIDSNLWLVIATILLVVMFAGICVGMFLSAFMGK